MGTIRYWENDEGQWYWHLQDGNNRVIADGGEGYVDESGVEEAIENVKEEMGNVSTEKVGEDDVDSDDKEVVEQSHEVRDR
jgi:uncharacterized protein YegP (UPF0339 family)